MLNYGRYEALRDRCVLIANQYILAGDRKSANYWLKHRQNLYNLMYVG